MPAAGHRQEALDSEDSFIRYIDTDGTLCMHEMLMTDA